MTEPISGGGYEPPPTPPPDRQMERDNFCAKSMSEMKDLYVTLTNNGNPVGVFKGVNR